MERNKEVKTQLEIIDVYRNKLYLGYNGFSIITKTCLMISSLKTVEGEYVIEVFDGVNRPEVFANIFDEAEALKVIEGFLAEQDKTIVNGLSYNGYTHLVMKNHSPYRKNEVDSLLLYVSQNTGTGKPLKELTKELKHQGVSSLTQESIVLDYSELELRVLASHPNNVLRKYAEADVEMLTQVTESFPSQEGFNVKLD